MRARFLIAACLSLSACSKPEGAATSEELISADMLDGDSLPGQLADLAGIPELGQAIFSERNAGHCVLCHKIGGLEVPFQGNVGPDLSDVGARLSDAQIRLRIADASLIWPETIMPPYYRRTGLHQVGSSYEGQPVLQADQIEHLVAYLSEQKDLEREGE